MASLCFVIRCLACFLLQTRAGGVFAPAFFSTQMLYMLVIVGRVSCETLPHPQENYGPFLFVLAKRIGWSRVYSSGDDVRISWRMNSTKSCRRPDSTDRINSMVRGGEQTLQQACSQEYPGSARCVQSFDDSLDSAIRITYRISLRSSSMWEPRHPSLKVVLNFRLSAAQVDAGLRRTLCKEVP